eukprot:scaffold54755_cov32-Tisochrysis_lutea.AAC.2
MPGTPTTTSSRLSPPGRQWDRNADHELYISINTCKSLLDGPGPMVVKGPAMPLIKHKHRGHGVVALDIEAKGGRGRGRPQAAPQTPTCTWLEEHSATADARRDRFVQHKKRSCAVAGASGRAECALQRRHLGCIEGRLRLRRCEENECLHPIPAVQSIRQRDGEGIGAERALRVEQLFAYHRLPPAPRGRVAA